MKYSKEKIEYAIKKYWKEESKFLMRFYSSPSSPFGYSKEIVTTAIWYLDKEAAE